jgi:hypothetical protein
VNNKLIEKIFLVEGDSDIDFFSAYLKYNSFNENYRLNSIGGSDKNLITKALKGIKNDIKNNPIKEIGIILDLDAETESSKFKLIIDCFKEVFINIEPVLNQENFSFEFKLNEFKNVSLKTFFIDSFSNSKNLEDLLKKLVTTEPIAANCLTAWLICCNKNNRKIKNSDFLKFWREVYIRYDFCSDKKIAKHASKNCTIKNSYENMLKQDFPKAWNFDSEYLTPLKTYLQQFKQ